MMNIKQIFYKVRGHIAIWLVDILPDATYLRWVFAARLGYPLNLKNPQTFNEKLQWLKLYDKHPEYTKMVDKVEAKKYVASIIGEKYIVPTIGVWNSVDEIDWDKLPNQFVIKAAHDSGGVVICRDKSILDIDEAKKKLAGAGKKDYTKYNKEYAYHNVPHRFIAEQLLDNGHDKDIPDYKFFCFDGIPKFLFVATGRQLHDTRFDFYDTDFHHLPVKNGHPNADIIPKKPENFSEMLDVASRLSKGLKEVRVDLYNINGKIYFGELTFCHWSGFVPYDPIEWDYKFGKYLKLPLAN